MVNRLGSYPRNTSSNLVSYKMSSLNKIEYSLSALISKAKLNIFFIVKIKKLLPLNLTRLNQSYIWDLLDNHLIHYASPITLTYAWSFGSLAGICLVIQMVSGVFLAMHYTSHIDLAFSSIEYIMRDLSNGWLIRYIHANGASMCAGKTRLRTFVYKAYRFALFFSFFLGSLMQTCSLMLRYEKYYQFSFMLINRGESDKIKYNC